MPALSRCTDCREYVQPDPGALGRTALFEAGTDATNFIQDHGDNFALFANTYLVRS